MKTRHFRVASMAAALLVCVSAVHAGGSMKVYLLGTSGPEWLPGRLGISTLVEAQGQRLLFDVGAGTSHRMYETRVNPKSVTKIFLTHLHNDHYEGLPNLWMTPWFLLYRTTPLEVWGPPGTKQMIEGMRSMFAHDIEKRPYPLAPREALDIKVTEVEPDKVYVVGDGVEVTAFQVEHKDGDPSFGYRVDASGRSVLLSGDTTLNQNVIRYGKGVDLLVHNVIAFGEKLTRSGKLAGVLAKLTTPEQAAEVFNSTRPKMAVYSHIVKKDLPGATGDRAIVQRTRKAGYAGPLVMGQDRMTFVIEDAVKVNPPASLKGLPDLDGGESSANF